MPALPFLAVGLASAGTFAAIGAGIASIGGFTVAAAGTAASLAAGTISAAAATAIGAGTFAGITTAIQGGKTSDVFKSAILGGITSYAGSTIAKGIAEGVRAEAILNGTDPGLANAMGSVVSSAVAGGIVSGTSALLSNKDPLEALIKGGLSGAMGAAVGVATNEIVSKIPGLDKPPVNSWEASFQRAAKAAIATTISTGGNFDKAKTAVVNSFMQSAANGMVSAANKLRNDFTNKIEWQTRGYERSAATLTQDIKNHEDAVNQYNATLAVYNPLVPKLKSLYDQYEPLYKEYSELKSNYDSLLPYIKPHYRHMGRLNELANTLNALTPPLEAAYEEYKTLKPEMERLSRQVHLTGVFVENESERLQQHIEAVKQVTQEWIAQEEKNAEIVRGELDKWTYANNIFREAYGRNATENELKIFAQAGDIVEQVANNVAEYKNNLFAKEKGFDSYEEAEEQGVLSPDDFYAQTLGWESYAEKLIADSEDIKNQEQLNLFKQREQEAIDLGFKSVEDYIEANNKAKFDGSVTANEFYAKKEGWVSYQQKLEAEEDGFLTPEALTEHFKLEQARDNGFINYYDYAAAEGLPAAEFYVRQEGWASSEDKVTALLYGVTSPDEWRDSFEQLSFLEDGEIKYISVEDFAEDLGFKNESDYIKALGEKPVGESVNADEYYAKEEGWNDYNDKKLAIKNGIDTPDEWYESEAKKKADQEAYLSTLTGLQRNEYIRKQELEQINDKYSDEIAEYKQVFGSLPSESKLLYHNSRGTIDDFIEESIQKKQANDKGFDTYQEYIDALSKNPNAGWDNYGDKENAYRQNIYDALDWDEFKESDFESGKDFLRARSLNIDTPDDLEAYDEQLKQQQAEAEAIRAAEQEALAKAPSATTEPPVLEKEIEDVPVIEEVKPLPEEIIKEVSNLPSTDQTTTDTTETQDFVEELLKQETEEPSALDVLGQPLTLEAVDVTPDIVTPEEPITEDIAPDIVIPEEPVTEDIEEKQEDKPATYTIADEFGYQYVLDYSGNLVDVIPPEQEPTPEDIIPEVIPEEGLNLDAIPEADQTFDEEQVTEEEKEIVHSQKNDDGSATYIFDDGSSLTINPDGSVRDVTESTDDIVLEEQEEESAPPGGFVGPQDEDRSNRMSEEFARYLDYLQAGEPPPPDYEPPPFNEPGPYWDEFNQNLLDMLEEGRLPTQWQPNEDGTFTYMSDDGSTLTMNPDGSIVGYTEAPVGNLPGETPPGGGTGGGGTRPPAPAPAPRPPAPAPAPRPPAPAPRPPAPAPRPPAPAAPGLDMAALLATLSTMGGRQQQEQIAAPQQPVYAQTPEFDIVQAFAPTLYAERKKTENPYLSGLTDEV